MNWNWKQRICTPFPYITHRASRFSQVGAQVALIAYTTTAGFCLGQLARAENTEEHVITNTDTLSSYTYTILRVPQLIRIPTNIDMCMSNATLATSIVAISTQLKRLKCLWSQNVVEIWFYSYITKRITFLYR